MFIPERKIIMANNETVKRVELKDYSKRMSPKTTGFIVGVSIVLLAALMLCVNFGVFGGTFMGANTPESVAKTFVNALLNGQANGILNCYPDCIYSDRAGELEYLVESSKSDCYDNVRIVLGEVVDLTEMETDIIKNSWWTYARDESSISDVSEFKKVKFKVGYTYYDDDGYVSGEMLMVKYKGYWKVLTPNVLDDYEALRDMIHNITIN
jgi:hypothetical protein